MTDRSDQQQHQPSPAPPQPTTSPDVKPTVHRDPAPSPSQHNDTVAAARTNGTLPRAW